MEIISKKTNANILEDGTYSCPECGSNKKFKFSLHADGVGVFINYYCCTECNASIYFECCYSSMNDIEFKDINEI